MRRWLLITLVLLLSVRGWVGDAMAGDMLAARLAAANQVAVAVPDCHGSTAVAPALHHDGHDDDGQQMAASPVDGSTCSVCQVCSAAGLLLPALPHLPAAVAQAAPAARAAVILRIAPAELFKPPIS